MLESVDGPIRTPLDPEEVWQQLWRGVFGGDGKSGLVGFVGAYNAWDKKRATEAQEARKRKATCREGSNESGSERGRS